LLGIHYLSVVICAAIAESYAASTACQLKRWIQQQAAVALVPIYRIDFALHPFTRSINVILFVFWCLNSELQFTDD